MTVTAIVARGVVARLRGQSADDEPGKAREPEDERRHVSCLPDLGAVETLKEWNEEGPQRIHGEVVQGARDDDPPQRGDRKEQAVGGTLRTLDRSTAMRVGGPARRGARRSGEDDTEQAGEKLP